MVAGYHFVSIYAQLTAALLPEQAVRDAALEKNIADFLTRTIHLVPFHLRMGVRVAETVLLFWLVCTVRGFVTGTAKRERIRATLLRFERLSGVCATLLRLYRSLILLAWFEREAA